MECKLKCKPVGRSRPGWNAEVKALRMENGVKQGGVLSPTLFCIYFDELLRRLEGTGVGCHIGHMSYASFGYADDIILLSPSICGLEILVKTAETFNMSGPMNSASTIVRDGLT